MRGRRSGIFTGAETRSESDIEVERALSVARSHIRRASTIRFAAYSVALPVLWAALWVLVSRFTLLEPPRWPAALALPLWLCALFVWYWLTPVSRAQSARYLDRRLGLDDRLSTVLEMDARERWTGVAEAAAPLVERLRSDTAIELTEKLPFLRASSARVRLAPLVGALILTALCGALMVAPSSMDAVKIERHEVQRIVEAQVKQIEALRADLVSRPGLPDSLKSRLDAELKALDARLRSGPVDRADALAAISASEEKVRSLLPDADSSQYEPLVRAAQLVQSAAQSYADWDPLAAKETDDLGRGAEASDHLSAYFSQFTPANAGTTASSLERASAVASDADSNLGRDMLDAAGALRVRDKTQFQSALADAVTRFRSAQAAQQSAQAVENTLAKLDDGRQSVANTGATAAKRQQVGFRRADTTPVAAGSQGSSAAQSGTPAAGGGNTSLDGSSPRIGQNVPAFGGSPPSAGGAPPSQAGTTSQPSGAGGAGQANRPGSNAGSGAPGSGAGGSGASQNNPTSGQLSAPVRVGGTTAAGGGAAGNGVGGATTSAQPGQGQSQPEQLYVPGSTPVARTGIGGQAAPENRPDAVEGKATTGDPTGARPAEAGPGELNQIKTPYTEVVGEYAEQATQALERAYIPPDAKEYVRNYFTELSR